MAGKAIDLIGKRFNSLVVLRRSGLTKSKRGAEWVCRCDCGNEAIVRADFLKSDHTTSCGCIKADSVRGALSRRRRDDYLGFNRDDL